MWRRTLMVLLAGGALALAACDDETGIDEERFSATLSGGAERPNPVSTNASGTATFTVDGNTVDFSITAANLTDATAAHIHGPATTSQSVGVLVTLFSAAPPGVDVSSGALNSGTFPSTSYTLATGVTMDSVLKLMRGGLAYVNVHTVANPAGHIRGQIAQD